MSDVRRLALPDYPCRAAPRRAGVAAGGREGRGRGLGSLAGCRPRSRSCVWLSFGSRTHARAPEPDAVFGSPSGGPGRPTPRWPGPRTERLPSEVLDEREGVAAGVQERADRPKVAAAHAGDG